MTKELKFKFLERNLEFVVMHVIALLQLLLPSIRQKKAIGGRAPNSVCPSALEGWWRVAGGWWPSDPPPPSSFVIEAAESIEDTYPPSASIEINMGGSGECACSWFCYSGVHC